MFSLAKFHCLREGSGLVSLASAITTAGLTSNCKLILDPGIRASYTSGQKWNDVSGNGYDFFLGDGSGVSANDPTFTGSAGDLSSNTYWGFDGSQYFTYDTTNEAWMNNLHKNGALFSLICAIYVVNITDPDGAVNYGTNGSTLGAVGSDFRLDSSEKISFRVTNGTITPALEVVATTGLSTGAWHIVGLSIDENGGNVSFFYADGAYNRTSAFSDTFDAAYLSPSGANATCTMQIASIGNADGIFPNGYKLGFFGMWEGVALTKANFDLLFGLLRGRYRI